MRASVDGEVLILAEPLVEKVLGEGVEVADRFSGADLIGRRYDGPGVRARGRRPRQRRRGQALPGRRRRLRHHRGRHRPRPHRPGLRRGRLRGRGRQRPLRPDAAGHPLQPGQARRPLRPPRRRLRGPLRQGPRGDPRADRRPRAPRPALPRAGLRALLPALLALRHAAALLRDLELVRRAPPQVKDQLLANNETIGWHPEHVKHGRFGKWLENNVDWALSRDRYWGTPLPVWRCADHDCGELYCAGSVAELARARRGRGPRRPPPPLHRRGRRSSAGSAAARCAGSSR